MDGGFTFTWGPNEGGYLLLGNVLWAGGAQALYGLKGIGIVRELQFVKGAGIVGNFGKNALPFLSQPPPQLPPRPTRRGLGRQRGCEFRV